MAFCRQSALDRRCKCGRIGEGNKSITQARGQILDYVLEFSAMARENVWHHQ
jgi:hypothetical protein